jgi:hypothetical protein
MPCVCTENAMYKYRSFLRVLVFILVCLTPSLSHWQEHKLSPKIYQKSHKPHHRFLNPKMFDAFNGSVADTVAMILVPLFLTANVFSPVPQALARMTVSLPLRKCLPKLYFSVHSPSSPGSTRDSQLHRPRTRAKLPGPRGKCTN